MASHVFKGGPAWTYKNKGSFVPIQPLPDESWLCGAHKLRIRIWDPPPILNNPDRWPWFLFDQSQPFTSLQGVPFWLLDKETSHCKVSFGQPHFWFQTETSAEAATEVLGAVPAQGRGGARAVAQGDAGSSGAGAGGPKAPPYEPSDVFGPSLKGSQQRASQYWFPFGKSPVEGLYCCNGFLSPLEWPGKREMGALFCQVWRAGGSQGKQRSSAAFSELATCPLNFQPVGAKRL